MNTNHFIVKTGTSKNTLLEDKFSKFVATTLVTQDDKKIDRWEIYNLIIKELLLLESGNILFSEIQYRITGNEDPNNVFLDIINRIDSSELNNFLSYLIRCVNDFNLEDLGARFINIKI